MVEVGKDSQRFRDFLRRKREARLGSPEVWADDSTTTGSRERASGTAIAAMTQEREKERERESDGRGKQQRP